jgi:hypothetical protein
MSVNYEEVKARYAGSHYSGEVTRLVRWVNGLWGIPAASPAFLSLPGGGA